MISGHPISTGFHGLTGCQRDPRVGASQSWTLRRVYESSKEGGLLFTIPFSTFTMFITSKGRWEAPLTASLWVGQCECFLRDLALVLSQAFLLGGDSWMGTS